MPPSSRKSLPFLKEYENISNLYAYMNGTPNLVVDCPLVTSYNQLHHIPTNVNYLFAIIISIHTMLSHAFRGVKI